MAEHNESDGQNKKWRADGEKFVILPHSVLYDAELSAGAIRAYCLLCDLGWRTGTAEPEMEEAAALIGVGEKALRGHIRELADKGLVTVKRRGLGQSNAYTLHGPNGVKQNGQNDRSATVESTDPSRARAAMDVEPLSPIGEELTDKGSDVAPAARKRDIVFDAMADATASDPSLEGALIGTQIAKLRKHPDYVLLVEIDGKEAADERLATEILLRAVKWRTSEQWSHLTLTPAGLVKHWRRLAEQPTGQEMNRARLLGEMERRREERDARR
jgi:hypothetical protein